MADFQLPNMPKDTIKEQLAALGVGARVVTRDGRIGTVCVRRSGPQPYVVDFDCSTEHYTADGVARHDELTSESYKDLVAVYPEGTGFVLTPVLPPPLRRAPRPRRRRND